MQCVCVQHLTLSRAEACVLTSWLSQKLWLPCYITLHVALPLEGEVVGGLAALKPEPPLNCIMWTQWLKPATVNTCTCNFVSEGCFQWWEWPFLDVLPAEHERMSVWEVQCDEPNRAWRDVCEVPAEQWFQKRASILVVTGRCCWLCALESRTASLRGRHSCRAARCLLLPADSC